MINSEIWFSNSLLFPNWYHLIAFTLYARQYCSTDWKLIFKYYFEVFIVVISYLIIYYKTLTYFYMFDFLRCIRIFNLKLNHIISFLYNGIWHMKITSFTGWLNQFVIDVSSLVSFGNSLTQSIEIQVCAFVIYWSTFSSSKVHNFKEHKFSIRALLVGVISITLTISIIDFTYSIRFSIEIIRNLLFELTSIFSLLSCLISSNCSFVSSGLF